MSHAIISKTREDYNRIAKHFSATRTHLWPEFKYFSRFVKNGQTVLDWGCGTGRLWYCFEGKNIKYFGVDQSQELIKIARKNFAGQIQDGGIRFFCTQGGLKKFSAESFDVVFMISSLFHLPTEATRLAILKNTYQQMKVGAKIVILVWNLESDWAKIKRKKDWKQIGENDFLIPWKNPAGEIMCERYYHHFSTKELGGLLQSVGFVVQKMKLMDGSWGDSKGGRNLVAVAIKKAP